MPPIPRLRGLCAFIVQVSLLAIALPVLAQRGGGVLDEAMRDAVAQADLDRALDLVRPQPASGPAHVDTRVPGVDDARHTIDRLVARYPVTRQAEARGVFIEMMAAFRRLERKHAIPRNDMAGALATFIAGSYTGYHGRLLDDSQFATLVSTLRARLAAHATFAAAPLTERQRAFEQLALLGTLSLGTYAALEQQPSGPNASAVRAGLRDAGARSLQRLFGLPPDEVRIEDLGFVAAPTAAAAPTHGAAPLPQPDAATSGSPIEYVALLTRWSPVGVGGSVVMRYRPAILYADGRYTLDAARALEEGAPKDGHWARIGDAVELTGADGKTTRVQRKMFARPARSGQTLQGSYRALSGAGLAHTNVPSVVAFETFDFGADGTVRMGRGGGASGGGVVTHAGTEDTARYRLEGWSITFIHPDGRSERRLFYLFPDGDRAIGLGSTTLSSRR